MYKSYFEKFNQFEEEEKDCCDNKTLIKNVCFNCGLVSNELQISEYDYDNDNKDFTSISFTNVSGYSNNFNHLKRLHKWGKSKYYISKTMYDDKIIPVIEKILDLNDLNGNLKCLISLYKDYYDNTVIKRRGKIKILILVFIVFVYCNTKNLDFNITKTINHFEISNSNVKKFRKIKSTLYYEDYVEEFIQKIKF